MKIDISHIQLPEDFHKVSDFYIPENNPSCGILYPSSKNIGDDVDYMDIVNLMLSEAQKKTKIEFSLELVHEKERIILRGHSIKSIEGKVFIFRRLPSYIPNIDDIGLPKNIIDLLLHERLNRGGLVIIAGETGQGKSTTAAATIAYRLTHFSSFCLTIEDPIELPLQGFYKKTPNSNTQGVCFQTNIEGDEIAASIKSSLRCYPSISNSILFLGEVRDSLMASEVLKIAANGHLVITTMHGSDIPTAIKRFIGMAAAYGSTSVEEVNSMFSSVFRLLIHQRMGMASDGKKVLIPRVLVSPGATSSVATRLREGKVEMLATELQAQHEKMISGRPII